MFTKTATAEAAQGREVLRITLTIALCMLAGQLFNFESAVYLALFSTIVMFHNYFRVTLLSSGALAWYFLISYANGLTPRLN